MSKKPLTDAMKDSHRITLAIHLAAAERAKVEGNWTGAATALQLALIHANAIGHRETKRNVFAALNVARSWAKRERANATESEKDLAA